MSSVKRLLVIAPGVTQEDVGEVLLAYRWLAEFAKHYEVTLITMDIKGRKTIPDGELPIEIIRFKDYGSIPGQERINSMLKPWYPLFYVQARRWLRRNGKQFDWIHQLNPFAMRYPSPAAGMGLSYSLGPLAGGVATPAPFQSEMGGSPWFVKLRGLDAVRAKVDPWLRESFLGANAIFVAASYVQETLRSRYQKLTADLVVESEHGVSEVFPRSSEFMPGGKLRLLYVGRVIRTKGVRDAIRALARLRDLNVEFTVVGAGEDLDACEREADTLGVADKVHFVGRKPHSEIMSYYLNSDIMVFPSFREASGGVVIEAMQAGLPQLVAKRGGPADLVDSKIGRSVDVTTPEKFAEDIASEIRGMADPHLLEQLSRNAHAECEAKYFWGAKFERITAILNDAMERNCEASTPKTNSGVSSAARKSA